MNPRRNITNPEERRRIGETIAARRQALHLSARELARRAGVDTATVTRLEQGAIAPKAENLAAMARVLSLSVRELFALADWLQDSDLPALAPYLRKRYHQMPPEAVAEIEAHFRDLAARYGYDPGGPGPGEDEQSPAS